MKLYLIPILLVFAVGCSDPNIGTVSGTVSVDGVPAEQGAITFLPEDGKSGTAGAPIEQGKYTANVPIGNCKVQLRVTKKVGEKKLYDTPDSPISPVFAEVLPAKYNDETELTFEVKPGANTQDYDIALE